MEKSSFFDTNVIINYASYFLNSSSRLNEKCFKYIDDKKARFIICYFVQKEILNFIKKRTQLYKEVISKIEDPNHSFEENKLLSKKDIPYAKKLYEFYKDQDIKVVTNIFLQEKKAIETKIELFFKIKLDEIVVPIELIDKDLANILHNFIDNFSDCNILSSAIQEQQNRETFFFVTCDDHFNPNNYEFIKEDLKLEKYNFPELKNLLF